jgi:hypothetical protein
MPPTITITITISHMIKRSGRRPHPDFRQTRLLLPHTDTHAPEAAHTPPRGPRPRRRRATGALRGRGSTLLQAAAPVRLRPTGGGAPPRTTAGSPLAQAAGAPLCCAGGAPSAQTAGVLRGSPPAKAAGVARPPRADDASTAAGAARVPGRRAPPAALLVLRAGVLPGRDGVPAAVGGRCGRGAVPAVPAAAPRYRGGRGAPALLRGRQRHRRLHLPADGVGAQPQPVPPRALRQLAPRRLRRRRARLRLHPSGPHRRGAHQGHVRNLRRPGHPRRRPAAAAAADGHRGGVAAGDQGEGEDAALAHAPGAGGQGVPRRGLARRRQGARIPMLTRSLAHSAGHRRRLRIPIEGINNKLNVYMHACLLIIQYEGILFPICLTVNLL